MKCTVYFQNLTTGVCCAQNVTYSTPTRAKLFFLLKLSRFGEIERGDRYKVRAVPGWLPLTSEELCAALKNTEISIGE